MVDAFNFMVEVLSKHIDNTYGYGIMFKIYQPGQSTKGHSVLFLKDVRSQIFFIDPQQSIIQQVTDLTTSAILVAFNNLYKGYTEIDLCFSVMPNVIGNYGQSNFGFEPTRIPRPMDHSEWGVPMHIINTLNAPRRVMLRERGEKVEYKGGKNKKMSKRKRKIKSQIKYKLKRTTQKKISTRRKSELRRRTSIKKS